MANVLIAGCGDVGTRLGLRLVAEGHEVWGLRRNVSPLPCTIRPLAADLCDARNLVLPDRIDVVVYTAAATGRTEAAYRSAYVDGVRNIIRALNSRESPVARFIFVSSTGVYAQRDGEWVDEGSPAEPGRFSGRLLLEGEGLTRASGVPFVVVRLAGIYGPGRHRLIERVLQGQPCGSEPPRYTNRIHSDDCAAVLAFLLQRRDPAELYIGVDDEPAPECEVMDWLAVRLGVRPPARESATDRQDGIDRGKRCRNDRLRAAGFQFQFPTYREGYEDVLRCKSG